MVYVHCGEVLREKLESLFENIDSAEQAQPRFFFLCFDFCEEKK